MNLQNCFASVADRVASDTTTCSGGQIVGAEMCEDRRDCPGQFRTPQNTCEDLANCNPGQFVNTTTNRCENCASGYVSPGGMVASCTQCTNDVMPNSDNSMCVCPGNMQLQSGQTDMCECPSGMQVFGTPNMCETPMNCNAGQFRTAQNTCQDCNAGEVSPGGGVTSCTACTNHLIPNSQISQCVCPTGDELIPGETDMCRTPANCPNNLIRNTATNICECQSGMQIFGDPNMCETPVVCQGNLVRNAQNMCECPSGQRVFATPNICETPRNCTGDLIRDANNMCVCPLGRQLVRGSTNQCESAASLSCAPGRFINGNRCENCQGNSVSPGGGVKQCTPCTGGQVPNANNSVCETPPAPPPPPAPEPKDNSAQTRALIGMGALVLSGALIHGSGIFTFSPDYAFSHNGLLSYGGKLQYQNGNFSAFWSGGENNGGFYSEGIEYAEEFWRLGYTAKLQDAGADWDVYANMQHANFQTGFNAGYISDADSDALSLSWQNRAEWQYADWQITPSANLFWRQGETDADTVNFRVNLRREF